MMDDGARLDGDERSKTPDNVRPDYIRAGVGGQMEGKDDIRTIVVHSPIPGHNIDGTCPFLLFPSAVRIIILFET